MAPDASAAHYANSIFAKNQLFWEWTFKDNIGFITKSFLEL
jgi:hypothetical protein